MKEECLEFIKNNPNIQSTKLSILEKFISSYYDKDSINVQTVRLDSTQPPHTNSQKIENKIIVSEYDNYTEPQIDCLSAFCQEAFRAFKSIDFESNKADSYVACVLNDIYNHGIKAGEKIASKYSKTSYDDDAYFYNFSDTIILNKLNATLPSSSSPASAVTTNITQNINKKINQIKSPSKSAPSSPHMPLSNSVVKSNKKLSSKSLNSSSAVHINKVQKTVKNVDPNTEMSHFNNLEKNNQFIEKRLVKIVI